MIGRTGDMDKLMTKAEKKGIDIVLPLQGKALRLVARIGDKIIDYQDVKPKETVEAAAQRMLRRMTRERILD